jgi:hypothetical protein
MLSWSWCIAYQIGLSQTGWNTFTVKFNQHRTSGENTYLWEASFERPNSFWLKTPKSVDQMVEIQSKRVASLLIFAAKFIVKIVLLSQVYYLFTGLWSMSWMSVSESWTKRPGRKPTDTQRVYEGISHSYKDCMESVSLVSAKSYANVSSSYWHETNIFLELNHLIRSLELVFLLRPHIVHSTVGLWGV